METQEISIRDFIFASNTSQTAFPQFILARFPFFTTFSSFHMMLENEFIKIARNLHPPDLLATIERNLSAISFGILKVVTVCSTDSMVPFPPKYPFNFAAKGEERISEFFSFSAFTTSLCFWSSHF